MDPELFNEAARNAANQVESAFETIETTSIDAGVTSGASAFEEMAAEGVNFASESAFVGTDATIWAGFGAVYLVIIVAIYIYSALCFYLMAKKLQIQSAWMAWVPIANFFLLPQMAGKSAVMGLLFFIPFVNIFVSIWFMYLAAQRLGKSPVWGVLTVIPFINFIALGYLAFGKADTTDGSPQQAQAGEAQTAQPEIPQEPEMPTLSGKPSPEPGPTPQTPPAQPTPPQHNQQPPQAPTS